MAGEKEAGQQPAEPRGTRSPTSDAKSETAASCSCSGLLRGSCGEKGDPRGRSQGLQVGKGGCWHQTVGHLGN